MFTLILLIITFTLGYVYANTTRNDTSQTSRTIMTVSQTIMTTARTYIESSMQTPYGLHHSCHTQVFSHKYNSPPPPNISTYCDCMYTLKELQYPAQLGDILLKLQYNQCVGYVNSPGLQLVENNGILAEGKVKGNKWYLTHTIIQHHSNWERDISGRNVA